MYLFDVICGMVFVEDVDMMCELMVCREGVVLVVKEGSVSFNFWC